MQARRGLAVTDVLTCPVCGETVESSSSMCLACHLPMKDVVANQDFTRRTPRKGRLLRRRLLGLMLYPAAVLWCSMQLPTSILFVAPAALVGAWFHVGRGRPWLGMTAFLAIVAILPLLFWPSMLTGLFSDLTSAR